VRLDERSAHRLDPGIAADLALIVDDLAAAFDDVEDHADVMRVAVPGAGAGIAQDVGLDLAGRKDRETGRPDDRARHLDDPRRAGRIAAEHRERPALPVDRDIVAAVIAQVADAADGEEGDVLAGREAAAPHIADRTELA